MEIDEQQKIIARGRDAKALKTNPVLEECMSTTMEDLFSRWCATGPKDAEERMAIWSTAQALGEFKKTLDFYISSGLFEEKTSDHNTDK